MTPMKTLVLFFLTFVGATAAAQDETTTTPKRAKPDDVECVRYNKGEKIGRLETAVVTYENVDSGRKVTLVSAVHVGDKSYYDELKKRLANYDVVLYEGVRSGSKDGPAEEMLWISRVQLMLKDYLGLEYQKDHIDYSAKNFSHADMTAEEVQERLAAEGVELIPFAPALKSFGPIVEAGLKFLAAATNDSDVEALRMMRTKMKTTMAGFLGTGQKLYDRFKRTDEKKRDEVVIAARNDLVLAHLADVFEKTNAKNVAIFYGAAHMPDLGGHLIQRFGMKRSGVEWVPAWTISLDGKNAESAPEAPVESAPASRPAPSERRRI